MARLFDANPKATREQILDRMNELERIRGINDRIFPDFTQLHRNAGCAWIHSIEEGFTRLLPCHECGAARGDPTGELSVMMDPKRGVQWPGDVLGCGAYPLFVVSERVIEAWAIENIGQFPAHKVTIVGPLPRRLVGTEPPHYFWVDGEEIRGARMDFGKSGFVSVEFCPVCGVRSDDTSASYRKQHSSICPFSLIPGSWNETHLFTTEPFANGVFLHRRGRQFATKHRLTNFRFVPVEQGANPTGRGLRYLNPKQKREVNKSPSSPVSN